MPETLRAGPLAAATRRQAALGPKQPADNQRLLDLELSPFTPPCGQSNIRFITVEHVRAAHAAQSNLPALSQRPQILPHPVRRPLRICTSLPRLHVAPGPPSLSPTPALRRKGRPRDGDGEAEECRHKPRTSWRSRILQAF